VPQMEVMLSPTTPSLLNLSCGGMSEGLRQGAAHDKAHAPKVGDANVTLRVQDEVLGLQIAVHDAALVQVS